jgi:hypothetical protein
MPARSRGFTLVEIAIVLVIIGLLLGGVLKGRELITSAKVRSLNDRVSSVTAAWFAFQDRFRAIPGDYNQALANIPQQPTAPLIADGLGNGLLDTPADRAQAWIHLAAAGLISGTFDNAPVAANYTCTTASCLDNGFGRGMVLSYSALTPASTVNGHELLSGTSIASNILAELDRKVDDGLPNTGNMTLGDGAGGFAGPQRNACLEGTSYAFTNPSANCAAVFRNL